MIAIGPIFGEQGGMAHHVPLRDEVAAQEAALAGLLVLADTGCSAPIRLLACTTVGCLSVFVPSSTLASRRLGDAVGRARESVHTRSAVQTSPEAAEDVPVGVGYPSPRASPTIV